MSFISRVELKYQLQSMGIKVENGYIKRSDLEKIVGKKQILADATDIKIVSTKIQKFLNQFDIFKKQLKNPDLSLKKRIFEFDKGKEPHEETNGEKVYKRKHYMDWEDNTKSNLSSISINFDRVDYNFYVQEYQDFKIENTGESDGYIESSDALTAMLELKELIDALRLLHRKNILSEVQSITFKLRSLNKLLFGNDEVQSWFYAKNVDGLSSFLHFLAYALKNYY